MTTTTAPRLVVQTMGMGVDSAAWLTAVLRGDIARDFELADLVVVTAMTGDESDRTRRYMETYLLPLMREHSIRYVQLARAGWSETEGVEVLSDSRVTEKMVMRGRVALSDEALRAGTIPQQSNRQCSYRFKGWVLDTWLAAEFGDTPRRHVVGFAAEETGRAARDDGYSRGVVGKVPWYPLIELDWDRTACLAYLARAYGLADGDEWPRSCCGFCPFQAGPDIARMGQRWQAEPQQAATAVRMEAPALALNPRMKLFGTLSAAEAAHRFGLGHVVDQVRAELADRPAAIYEVRRVYRRAGDKRNPAGVGNGWILGPDKYAKGNDVWRSLRNVWAGGTLSDARAELAAMRDRVGGELDADGRLWVKREAGPAYPDTEHYYAIAPAGIADKERDAFAEMWDWVAAQTLEQQGSLF